MNTIPVKCSLPPCQVPIPEATIHALLKSEFVSEGIYTLGSYSAAQLRVALDSNRQEIPITCAECNQYSEVYVPAPAGFWDELASKRQKFIIQLEQKHHQMKEEYKKQSEEYYRSLLKDIETHKQDMLSHGDSMTSRMEELEGLKTIWGERLATVKGCLLLYAAVPDSKEPDDAKEFQLDEYETLILKARQEISQVPADERIQIKARLKGFLSFLSKYTAEKLDLESLEKEKKDLLQASKDVAGAADAFVKTAIVEAKKMADEVYYLRLDELNLEKHKQMEDLLGDLSHVAVIVDQKDEKEAKSDGIGTVQFFICKNEFCTGAFCMRCETFCDKTELKGHVCRIDHLEDLYNDVLFTLAEAGSRKCPQCGTVGLKDLACTHITCDKCGSRWCYHCQVLEKNLAGGFSAHNQWNLNTPEGSNRCPMYLQYKYGERAAGERTDGDPAKSLEKYHRTLQEQAIEKLQARTDPKLWEEMIAKKFPNGGIFAVGPAKPITAQNVAQVLNDRDRQELAAQQRIEQRRIEQEAVAVPVITAGHDARFDVEREALRRIEERYGQARSAGAAHQKGCTVM
eukprot:TRINITY_DN8806_c0_g1_i1.p1 TRINITY_DN8806_c0_g1~~TRINITY_DN8806_c0_g1_i1.p1  ORF type:complete len:621 (+),score=176.81 TRINITY_DN8806_c0_g1_i1:151-1863(+)